MTNRRELADRLEAYDNGSVSERPWEIIADATEAARLLREPVAGEVEAPRPGELFWGVMRASHIAQNAASVLRKQPDKIGIVLSALDQLAADLDEVLNPTAILRARLDAEGKGEA